MAGNGDGQTGGDGAACQQSDDVTVEQASVSVSASPLTRNPPFSTPQFWVHAAPLSKPATFEFEAVNGAKVSATVDDPLKSQTLPVNFV